MKKTSLILIISMLFSLITIPSVYASSNLPVFEDFDLYTGEYNNNSGSLPAGWTANTGANVVIKSSNIDDMYKNSMYVYNSDSAVVAKRSVNAEIDLSKKYLFSFDLFIPEQNPPEASGQLVYVYVGSTATFTQNPENVPLFGMGVKYRDQTGKLSVLYCGTNASDNGKWWFSAPSTNPTIEPGTWNHFDALFDPSKGTGAYSNSVVYYFNGTQIGTHGIGKTDDNMFTNICVQVRGGKNSGQEHGGILDNIQLREIKSENDEFAKFMSVKNGTGSVGIVLNSTINEKSLTNARINIERFDAGDYSMKNGAEFTSYSMGDLRQNGFLLNFDSPLVTPGEQYRVTVGGLEDIFGNVVSGIYDIVVLPEETDSLAEEVFKEGFENYTSDLPEGWDPWRLTWASDSEYPSLIKITPTDIDADTAIAVNQTDSARNHIAAIKKTIDLGMDSDILSYEAVFDMYIPNFATQNTTSGGTAARQTFQIQLSNEDTPANVSKPAIGFKGTTSEGGMKISYYNPTSSNPYNEIEAKMNGSTFRLTEGGHYTFKAEYFPAERKVIYHLNENKLGEASGISIVKEAFEAVVFGGVNVNVNVDNPDIDYNCYCKSITVNKKLKPTAEFVTFKITDSDGTFIPMTSDDESPVNGAKTIDLIFNRETEISDSEITVSKSGKGDIPFSGEYLLNLNTYRITLEEVISGNSTYTISVPNYGVYTEFDTFGGKFELSGFGFYDENDTEVEMLSAGSSLKTSVNIVNTTSEDKQIYIMISVYRKNKLTEFKCKKIDAISGFNAVVSTPTVVVDPDDTIVKGFLWSDVSEPLPAKDVISLE